MELLELKVHDDGHGPEDLTKSDLISLKIGSADWKGWADGVHYDDPWRSMCSTQKHKTALSISICFSQGSSFDLVEGFCI